MKAVDDRLGVLVAAAAPGCPGLTLCSGLQRPYMDDRRRTVIRSHRVQHADGRQGSCQAFPDGERGRCCGECEQDGYNRSHLRATFLFGFAPPPSCGPLFLAAKPEQFPMFAALANLLPALL